MMGAVDVSRLNWMTTRVDAALGWARKFSIFQYPFVTACCGMEYMATATAHYDMDRFGAGFPRFSPRQADVLFVVGTVSHKLAPILKRVYDQMADPKWVVAFGVCTCTGGFYDNYATVMGIDTIIPVDIYIPGCPPRPENVLDGLMKLQEKIAQGKSAAPGALLAQGPAYPHLNTGKRPPELQAPHRPEAHL
ncbi:MAG: NADH-quinone oxidoreductase subunit NuoB [Candidatus Omnitrophica bacterium]|nr:NADH-quinone oxidoreductase subunit NuoB [Candidatus Omnitrophota bacterium]